MKTLPAKTIKTSTFYYLIIILKTHKVTFVIIFSNLSNKTIIYQHYSEIMLNYFIFSLKIFKMPNFYAALVRSEKRSNYAGFTNHCSP